MKEPMDCIFNIQSYARQIGCRKRFHPMKDHTIRVGLASRPGICYSNLHTQLLRTDKKLTTATAIFTAYIIELKTAFFNLGRPSSANPAR